ESRAEMKQAIEKKKEDAIQKKRQAFQVHLARNDLCEGLLLSHQDQPTTELASVDIDAFKSRKITKDMLVSFLKVRGIDIRSNCKKEVVIEKGFLNRQRHVLTPPTANLSPNERTIPSVPTHFPLAGTQLKKPSDLATNASWVSKMLCAIGIDPDEGEAGGVGPEKIGHADKFYQMLLPRLQQHLDKRLNRSKHSHWLIVEFVIPNLAHLALLMVVQGHVRDSFVGVGPNDCLLSSNVDHFVECGDKNLHGAYLYFDQARGKFVRSGKVTGRRFLDRHGEHEKAAKNLNGESSRFYLTFPHSDSTIQTEKKRGEFEDLKQLIAFGMDLTGYNDWTVSIDDGGILYLPSSILTRFSALKGLDRGHHQPSLAEKTFHMVSYLVELAY
ncbi:MAG: hypothetical protein ACX936_21515, partial [Marinobacter sp.]